MFVKKVKFVRPPMSGTPIYVDVYVRRKLAPRICYSIKLPVNVNVNILPFVFLPTIGIPNYGNQKKYFK